MELCISTLEEDQRPVRYGCGFVGHPFYPLFYYGLLNLRENKILKDSFLFLIQFSSISKCDDFAVWNFSQKEKLKLKYLFTQYEYLFV